MDLGFENLKWKVPITIATGHNHQALTFLLEDASTTVTLDVGPDDWIKVCSQSSPPPPPTSSLSSFPLCSSSPPPAPPLSSQLNPGQFGFYRVHYTPDTFTPLLAALNLSCTPGLSDVALPPQDRLGLQNDAFALVRSDNKVKLARMSPFLFSPQARAGVGSTVEVLRLFRSFSQETNYTVWENLATNLSAIDRLLSYTDFYDLFKSYGEGLFLHTVLRMGWDAKESESECVIAYISAESNFEQLCSALIGY